jgi:hypothetical protein
MNYIFMDESGCLGFDLTKPGTSKNFVISFLFIEASQKRSIEKIIKSAFRSMDKKVLKRHSGVLHAYKEAHETKMKILNKLSAKSVHVMVIRLNKHKVYASLKDEKAVLYNYVTNILLDRLVSKRTFLPDGPIKFIASRRETNRFLNENFKSYLQKQVSGKLKIEISIDAPAREKCLQAVDLLSWSIFRHYEHKDDQYYKVIKKLILEDNTLFR